MTGLLGLSAIAYSCWTDFLQSAQLLLTAALRGSTEIALGDVIGSNSANVGLILGMSVVIFPLAAGARFLRREVPFMLLTSAALLPLLADGRLGRLEGVGLITDLLVYLWVLLRGGQSEAPQVEAAFAEELPGKLSPL